MAPLTETRGIVSRRRSTRPPTVAPPAPVRIRIGRIGADGDGIGFGPDGSPFYVPLTVPGDLVLAQPVARRGEGWAADIGTMVEDGPARRAPSCAHFGVCGGCSAQHLEQSAYLDWKLDRLAAALRRAGFEHPAIASIQMGLPGSRRRMDLAVRRVPRGTTLPPGTPAGGIVVGLHRSHRAEIVDILECPILHPALFRLIAPLRGVLAGLSGVRREASVVANLLDSGPDLLLRSDAALSLADRAALTEFARTHALPRLSWAYGTETPEPVCILRPPVTSLSGVSVAPPPGAFLQATHMGEAAIVDAVLDGLPEKQTARARVLELFAGCGTIGFALARRIKVTAVEGDETLAAAYREGIARSGLTGKIEVERRDLSRQPFLASELSRFAAVVLDPPHAGAAAQMPYVAQARVPTVIYVSCDPVSLGRDAAVLRGAGYRLEKATPIDQFLWSARLEAVAVFRLGR